MRFVHDHAQSRMILHRAGKRLNNENVSLCIIHCTPYCFVLAHFSKHSKQSKHVFVHDHGHSRMILHKAEECSNSRNIYQCIINYTPFCFGPQNRLHNHAQSKKSLVFTHFVLSKSRGSPKSQIRAPPLNTPPWVLKRTMVRLPWPTHSDEGRCSRHHRCIAEGRWLARQHMAQRVGIVLGIAPLEVLE